MYVFEMRKACLKIRSEFERAAEALRVEAGTQDKKADRTLRGL